MNTPTDRPTRGPGRPINPPGFPHVGYSNAIASDGSMVLALAGQTDMGPSGQIRNPGNFLAQVEGAFTNIVAVLTEAGARPEDMTRMRIYVLDADAYVTATKEIGAAYRQHFGKWFPAMTFLQVGRLFDPEALIEIEVDAVM